MGKMLKPKKPTIKKPALPKKPREPERYNHKGLIVVGEIYDDEFKAAIGLNPYEEFAIGILDGTNTKPGKLMIKKHGEMVFAPLSDTYDEDMIKYKEKLNVYEGKVKALQPKIDIYKAAMAEYELNLLDWKRQAAQEALQKAKSKLLN